MSYKKITLILCLSIFLSAERGANAQTSVTYTYVSNAAQTFTVPPCVTGITVQMWGAGGGSSNTYGPYDNDGYKAGGPGAYYEATITGLSTGEVLNLYVPSGGQDLDGNAEVYDYNGVAAGGWPGGGAGGWGGDYLYGGGGGGYAGIAYNGTYYLVAGGGGGGGGYCCEPDNWGGGGGDQNGGGAPGGGYYIYCCNINYGYTAKGGSCSAGGAACSYSGYGYYGTAGSSLQGGAGGPQYVGDWDYEGCGGGGGGGYYGGGGGADGIDGEEAGSGGGGGSSFPCTASFTSGGITTTRITNTAGAAGNNSANYPAPGGAPATIGFGGYFVNGGNGEIIITYIPLIANGVVVGNDSCRGQNNGIATVSLTGGTTPFTYSWSPVGGTNDTATGLGEGTYTVTVISPCGATATASVTISQPNILGATTTIIDEVQCNSGSNGVARANALGGTNPFTYSWSTLPIQTGDTVTGLSAGTYTVSLEDRCGQSSTAKVTVTQPNVMTAFRDSVLSNVLCYGGATGSAAVESITGGGTPFTYAWAPGGNSTASVTGLTAGSYTLTVYDACAVTLTAGVTITQPATALSVSAHDSTEETCNGNSVGIVASTPAGGTGAYTYSWTPGSNTNRRASNLSAGTYTITVKDNNGCTATATAVITQPTTLRVTGTVTASVRCNGGATGGASCTPSGGTSPYTYLWNPGASNTQSISGLTAATYTIKVTDNHGCTASASATITQPSPVSVSVLATSNVLCNGGIDGSASATASNGTSPYTYTWSPGVTQTTANVNGLSAGVYTITVTDNCGQTTTASTTITQPTVLVGPAYTLANVLCNAGANGQVVDSANGGTSPYTYAWSDANSSTNMGVSGLSAGGYTVTVSDNNGCSLTASTVITQATTLTATSSVTGNVECNGQNNGSATSAAAGGTSPYTYSWTGGAGNANTASNLTAGTYTINITDNNGCAASSAVTVTQPAVLTVAANTPGNVICNGGSSGEVSSVTTGGTGPYTYAWSFGGSSDNGSGLSIGTYAVTVFDAHGCTATAQTTITQPIALIVGAGTVLNNLCFDVNVGTVVAYVGGGPAPYNYTWTPTGGSGDSAKGLSIGAYTVTVVDKDGCSGSASTTVTQPTQLFVLTDSVPDDGACTGSAWVYPSGGVGPYKYLWSDGNTSYIINDQCHGYYCCLITDANGCQLDECFHLSSYLGVDNITASNGKISVYPNPNTGEFTIESSGMNGESEVEIYNVLGAKISSAEIDGNTGGRTTINISTQPNGVYLYRVISKANGNLVGEGKIVLEK